MATLTVQGTKSVCFTRCDVCIIAIACDTFQNMLYLWLRLFLVFYLDGFGTSETVFAFLASVFIRRRRFYTYKLKKLARRQDISISEKRHLYITLAACCVVVSLFC